MKWRHRKRRRESRRRSRRRGGVHTYPELYTAVAVLVKYVDVSVKSEI